MRLKEISEMLEGELVGDGDVEIHGVSGIKEAHPGDITFLANPRYRSELAKTQASAVIVGRDVKGCYGKPFIKVDNPFYAFARVLELFAPKPKTFKPGIDPTAVLGENVSLGENVVIQSHVYLGDNVRIGSNTVIYPLVYIGDEVEIGSDTVIYPNVTIRERCKIGNGVIIHSGARIGTDGFGFAKVSDRHHKIPQIGTVIIEDDVEIGANTTIDRATMSNRATVIKRGTKIDNLVQIAHNVVIGENCLITAQVGIAGSTHVGNWVTFAGQSGSVGHVKIGDNVTVAARAGVTKDIPPNQFVSGFPAEPHTRELRVQAAIRRLPETVSQIRELEGKVADLEAKLAFLLEKVHAE
jgi:UDP-3-O-[3-hydroxymyristoyl] glucosamine N-acyltransferase